MKAAGAPPSTEDIRPAAVRTVRLWVALGGLVVVAFVPALATALHAVWQSGSAYRDTASMRLADTARTLAHAIESEIGTRTGLAQAVAAGIANGSIPRAQAQQWLDRSRIGQGRLLVWEDGRPAGGDGLPAQVAAQALAPGGAAVSNLFTRAGRSAPEVALSVPLPSRAHGLLSLVLEAGDLARLVPEQMLSTDGLLVAVTDGTGRLVARSRDGARLVGQPVPDWDKLQALQAPRGQFHALSAEGRGVVLSFEKLAGTPGWVVVVGEPLAVFDQGWQRPLVQIALGSALGMLAALVAAAWLARTIARPAQALARNARAVAAGGGQAGPAAVSAITEFEAMRASIEAAQATLQQRAEAERRNAQTLAANELRFRMLARTGSVVLWRGSPEGQMQSADGWEQVTGEPDGQALGRQWRQRVHPEDRPVLAAVQEAVRLGTRQVDCEFRLACKAGAWTWMRCRGAAVPAPDGAIQEWVGVLEDVSERHRAQARIVHMALHDALTGLPNRVEFCNRLETAIRRAGRGDPGAVLYIDLDRFKDVNDTLGHAVGDALLRAVTERLTALVRHEDTVARLAGDEFAIVQSRVSSPRDASELAARVVHTLSEPYDIQGHRVGIGASVGIMLIADGACDAERLLKYADMALYRAKQDGRGRHSFFEPEMDQRMQARRRSELELRAALERRDFEISYQPQVNPRERCVSGLAAALHWRHPERGLVPASEFAGLLDELGLSGQLVEWMLHRVCRDMQNWPECPKAAVDISAALPRSGAAVSDWVVDALRSTGLAPRRLELEVEERALLAHPENANRALHACSALGVRLTLSSIGSTHSGLGYLRRFPFDKVKIERSTLQAGERHVHSGAVVRALTVLCEELGLVVGAEGVDTASQFAALQAGDRMEVQGELFGGHRAADEVAAVFRALQ